MIPSSLFIRDLTLHLALEHAPVSQAEPCIRAYCEAAEQYLRALPANDPARKEILKRVLEVLDNLQRRCEAQRRLRSDALSRLANQGTYLRISPEQRGFMYLDL